MDQSIVWHILYIDDDPEACKQIKEFLEGEQVDEGSISVKATTDFGKGMEELETKRYDLVILDVRVGALDAELPEEEGIKALERIKERRFVPVIFYTGLPNLVRDKQQGPLIRVVEKTQTPQLIVEIRELIRTNLPMVNRALLRHLEAVQRDYMWEFVADNWPELGENPDKSALAYLLARRLALSLSGQGIKQLVADLGGQPEDATEEIHPMQYYIIPPVEASSLSGDIFYQTVNDINEYFVLLTPSCDMVIGREKAERLLFVGCKLLRNETEYTEWISNSSKENKLMALLKNNRQKSQSERFFYLPGALSIPDLIVDFQNVSMKTHEDINKITRLASVDSPFAEMLVSKFIRYYGRIGAPDLDLDLILQRLGS